MGSVHPENSPCHSERSEESPGKSIAKRFFVAPPGGTPQNDIRKREFWDEH